MLEIRLTIDQKPLSPLDLAINKQSNITNLNSMMENKKKVYLIRTLGLAM